MSAHIDQALALSDRGSLSTDPEDSGAAQGPAPVPLPTGEHEIWPWAVVRSAGFPFTLWERVCDGQAARLADEALLDEGSEYSEDSGGSEAAASARAVLQAAVEADFRDVPRRLAEAPDAGDVACAVLWQNPGFYRTALRPALDGEVRKKPRKQRERIAAIISYLQRYVVKNDSVGFFGPVAWAPLVGDGPPLEAAAGAALIARHTIKLESWAVQELADALLAVPATRAVVAPRLAPHVSVVDGRLRMPMGQSVALSPLQAAVMERCDGDRTAAEVADAIVGDPAGPAQRHDDVYEALEALEGRRWLQWRLNMGLSVDAHERLEAALDRVPASQEAERVRAAHKSVTDAIADLRGDERDPDALERGLRLVGERFSAVTGSGDYRRGGEAYAARTPLCLEARRDVDVHLGPGFVDAVGPPLDLLMRSARWLLAQAHDVFEERLRSGYRELAAGGGGVELVDLWMLGSDGWFDQEGPAFLDPVVAEFQSKWAEVLDYEGAEGEVRRSVEELREPVARAFGDAGPRTACFAQYASPDVMACWPDGAAEPQRYVLGELHLARNTTVTQALLQHHPEPDAVDRLWERDHQPARRVTLHGDDRATSNRLRPGVLGTSDIEVRVSPQSPNGREGAYRLADFTVDAEGDGRLVATSRRDGVRVELMRLVADAIELSCVNTFKLIPPSAHRPRVSIDRLVVSRESWTIDREEALGFARQPDTTARFLGARRLKSALGVPRHVFVVYGSGAKPVFVDLASPVSVDLLCRVVRRDDASQAVKVSEMLPRPEELWLSDADGQRYTSELRLGVRSVPTGAAAAR